MNGILGAIIGDICGSVYEFNNAKTFDEIEMFPKNCKYTDDTVLTCAVAKWLVETEDTSDKNLTELTKIIKNTVRKHPFCGYGGMFRKWFNSDSMEPFGSYGNGSAMRCSPTAYFANTLEEAIDLAAKSAKVTHNHPEGIKGAQATAAAIFLARSRESKQTIKERIEDMFGYKLGATVEEMRNKHSFDATCQITVPEAINAFLEGNTFEEVIKKAIWIGGDTDTIAAIAGSIAAAYYGIPNTFVEKCIVNLTEDLKEIILNFTKKCNEEQIHRSFKEVFEPFDEDLY